MDVIRPGDVIRTEDVIRPWDVIRQAPPGPHRNAGPARHWAVAPAGSPPVSHHVPDHFGHGP